MLNRSTVQYCVQFIQFSTLYTLSFYSTNNLIPDTVFTRNFSTVVLALHTVALCRFC